MRKKKERRLRGGGRGHQASCTLVRLWRRGEERRGEERRGEERRGKERRGDERRDPTWSFSDSVVDCGLSAGAELSSGRRNTCWPRLQASENNSQELVVSLRIFELSTTYTSSQLDWLISCWKKSILIHSHRHTHTVNNLSYPRTEERRNLKVCVRECRWKGVCVCVCLRVWNPYRSFAFFLSIAVMSSPPVVRRESAGVTHTFTHTAAHQCTHSHRQAETHTGALIPRAAMHRAESENSPSFSLLPPLSHSVPPLGLTASFSPPHVSPPHCQYTKPTGKHTTTGTQYIMKSLWPFKKKKKRRRRLFPACQFLPHGLYSELRLKNWEEQGKRME